MADIDRSYNRWSINMTTEKKMDLVWNFIEGSMYDKIILHGRPSWHLPAQS